MATVSTFDGQSFGKAIKTKRVIDLDLDMRSLADKLKISPSTLSRCENGMMPDLMTYRTLCEWLGTSMDLFFFASKPKRKSFKK